MKADREGTTCATWVYKELTLTVFISGHCFTKSEEKNKDV